MPSLEEYVAKFEPERLGRPMPTLAGKSVLECADVSYLRWDCVGLGSRGEYLSFLRTRP